jgi:cation diffusion facilitator family transporter
VHSVVDTGNQALLLYGMKRAKLPPNDRFPFGHGKEIYFWSFVVALLVFAAGAGVSFYEGVRHLRHPVEMTRPVVNYVVLAVAAFFEAGSWLVAFRGFRAAKGPRGYFEAVRRGKDPTTFVVLFEDTAALVGIAVAFAGVAAGHATGDPRFDGAASIVIGVILALTAFVLAYESKALLIGEAADPELVEGIRAVAARQQGIVGVGLVLTVHSAPDQITVMLSADFDDAISAGEVERIVARIEAEVAERWPAVRRLFVRPEQNAAAHRRAVVE